jgi:hypothetical protein
MPQRSTSPRQGAGELLPHPALDGGHRSGGAAATDGLHRLPGHFFAVYDGHGGRNDERRRVKDGDTELRPAVEKTFET